MRGPYLSTWLPATTLPGTWQQFWRGHTTAMGGIVRIDGTPYQFMVDPAIILNVPNGNYGTPTTVPWVRRMGPGHGPPPVERLRRARDLLTVKGFDTRSTVLSCYSGAGFTRELQAAQNHDIHLVGLDQLYAG